MHTLKTITLALMLIIFSVVGLRAEEVSSNDIDDATLIQYAMQLRETKPELFAGAQGILVLDIVPDSQAEKKGLQRGDIVVAYNGQQMNSPEQLISTIQSNAAKPQVELQFIRAKAIQVIVLQGGQIGIHLTDITKPELDRLQEEGEEAYYHSNYPTVLEKWHKGLERARELGDKGYISQFISNIGVVYGNLGDYPKALKYYQQALAIHQEIGDKRGEGDNLGNIGVVYKNLGDYPKALEYSQQALAIHQEIGGEVGDLGNIGTVYANLGDYPKALEYYQLALAIDKEIGNKRGEGRDLGNIGVVYNGFGNYPKALEYYQLALAIDKEIGNKRGEGADLTKERA